VMAVNLDGMFLVAQAVGAQMVRPGRGRQHHPDLVDLRHPRVRQAHLRGVALPGPPINNPAVYSASKAAVCGLTPPAGRRLGRPRHPRQHARARRRRERPERGVPAPLRRAACRWAAWPRRGDGRRARVPGVGRLELRHRPGDRRRRGAERVVTSSEPTAAARPRPRAAGHDRHVPLRPRPAALALPRDQGARHARDFAGQLDYVLAPLPGRAHGGRARGADDPARTLPERALLLTFDDGYADHYQTVFPLLDRLGLQGSFFPPARAILERRVLDVNKIHFLLAGVADDAPRAALEAHVDAARGDHELEPPRTTARATPTPTAGTRPRSSTSSACCRRACRRPCAPRSPTSCSGVRHRRRGRVRRGALRLARAAALHAAPRDARRQPQPRPPLARHPDGDRAGAPGGRLGRLPARRRLRPRRLDDVLPLRRLRRVAPGDPGRHGCRSA
jgi:hypothetical protein